MAQADSIVLLVNQLSEQQIDSVAYDILISLPETLDCATNPFYSYMSNFYYTGSYTSRLDHILKEKKLAMQTIVDWQKCLTQQEVELKDILDTYGINSELYISTSREFTRRKDRFNRMGGVLPIYIKRIEVFEALLWKSILAKFSESWYLSPRLVITEDLALRLNGKFDLLLCNDSSKLKPIQCLAAEVNRSTLLIEFLGEQSAYSDIGECSGFYSGDTMYINSLLSYIKDVENLGDYSDFDSQLLREFLEISVAGEAVFVVAY